MTNPRDSFTHLAHFEKLMLSFLFFLLSLWSPQSPFPALFLLFLCDYETRRYARLSDVWREIQRAPSDAARAGKSSAVVRVCARVYLLLSSPLLSHFPTRPLKRTELRGHCVVYRPIQRNTYSKKRFGANAAKLM